MDKANETQHIDMEIVEKAPFIYEFDIKGNEQGLPEALNNFQELEEFQKYFSRNTVSYHKKTKAIRFFTEEEIQNFREKITETAETLLFEAQKELLERQRALQEAKKREKSAQGVVDTIMQKISEMSFNIRSGKTEIDLPAYRTLQVPYGEKYYYYTWLDNGACVLSKVEDIPEEERGEIFNNMDKNNEFFEFFTKPFFTKTAEVSLDKTANNS